VAIHYKNLVVWQRADELFIEIHRLTYQRFPRDEQFELGRQLRRAAYSVAANIVEGSARYHTNDKLNFYNIASASLSEVTYGLHAAHRLGYLDFCGTLLVRRAHEDGRGAIDRPDQDDQGCANAAHPGITRLLMARRTAAPPAGREATEPASLRTCAGPAPCRPGTGRPYEPANRLYQLRRQLSSIGRSSRFFGTRRAL
jgi:four helix bundle protein